MPESEWYEHYLDVCRRSNDTPLPLEAFRRVASNYITKMHPVDGVWHYFECLPVVPQHANENPASDELTGFETRTRR